MTMEQGIHYRDPEHEGGGVSDVEVESVMKMLMAYQKARAEGVGQPNPELDHLLGAMQNSLPTDRPKDCPIDEELKFPSDATQPGPAPTSDEIIPKPFFVLRTKNEKQQKVFINVCGSQKIGAPDYGEETQETDDQVRAKLANFDPSKDPDCPDVRFPCSCLDPVLHKNKKDKTHVIYDVCFNRTVVESAMTVKSLKVFLIDMALTWLSQKYNTQLSADFQILDRKYKGKEVRKHLIRVDPKKGPIITELPDNDDDEEPVVPLLLRDKQGKSSGNEVEETCKSDEDANRDHYLDRYQELPKWTPDFHPSNTANGEMADAVTPTDQPVKTSRLSASSDNSASQHEKLISSQSSLAEPWLPTGMFRELNTPAPDPDLDMSVPNLNTERHVPDLEGHSPNLTISEENVETTPRKTSSSKFKFKKLEKKVENSGECIHDDVQQGPLVEELRAPKVHTEYIGRPVTTIVISVAFPLDFIGLEDMHVYMTSSGISVDTKAYGTIEVELQFYVSPAGVLGEYINCDKTLTFELPIVSYAEALKLKL